MTGPGGRAGIGYRRDLDGIRGLVVPLAFWWHAWILGLNEHLGGHGGVDVFFVLSGYLITSVLLEQRESYGKISLRVFYIRRALRLLPALFIMLLIAWWATSFFTGQADSYAKQAAVTIGYVSNWFFDRLGVLTHTWTLALEEQYYLLWPGVLVLALGAGVSRRKLAICSILIALSIWVVRYITHGWFTGALFNAYNTYGRVDGLFIGNALALAPELWRWASHRAVPRLAVAILVPTFLYQLWLPPQFEAPEAYQRGLFTIICLCTAAIIAHAHWNPSSRLVRLLSTQPLPAMGRISYGLYLYHVPVFALVAQLGLSVAPAIVTGIAATFAVSAASYHFVEEPFLRLKSRLAPRTRKDKTTTPT